MNLLFNSLTASPLTLIWVSLQNLNCFPLLTYSFPCQDLSVAGYWHGNTGGIDRNAHNRSGMLWEIERILKERIQDNLPLPKFLLMENVLRTVISPVKVEAFFLYEAREHLFLKPIMLSVKKESFEYAFWCMNKYLTQFFVSYFIMENRRGMFYELK